MVGGARVNEMEAELRYGSRCARPSEPGVRHVCDESRLWREMLRGGGDGLSGTHERGSHIGPGWRDHSRDTQMWLHGIGGELK